MENNYVSHIPEAIVDLVSVLCLVFLAGLALWVAVNYIIKRCQSRAEGISYVREFKQGKCAAVFLPALALYVVGIYDGGATGPDGLFIAIEKTLKLITLGYDTKEIDALMGANILYHYAVQACFLAVLLNAILFLVSLFSQWIWSLGQRIRHTLTWKNKLILIGNNPENRMIYRSESNRSARILEELSATERKQLPQDKEQLYMDGIPFRYVSSLEEKLRSMLKLAKWQKKEWVIVVNTLDDQRNVTLCIAIAEEIEKFPEDIRNALYQKFKVQVFGDSRYEAIYNDLSKRSLGCIQYVNKHQKIAMDFIDRYPFTKFMDDNQVDFSTSLVKENVSINAIFLGFGKTNRQIFLTSVANNQFLTGSAVNPTILPVHYHIFDKDPAENNKNLNHTYYRYRNEHLEEISKAKLEKKDYLPAPDLPATESYHHLDINAQDFYKQIKDIVTESKNSLHFVVISFGNDLENLDMAQKLIEKRREWDVSNLVIFARIRSWRKEQTLLKDQDCFFFGHEEDVVYHIDKILCDDLYTMAQLRNEIYDLEKLLKKERKSNPDFILNESHVQNNHAESLRKWYQEKTQLQRESSLYCCLSLRSKLNLMGLDYCKKESPQDEGMGKTEYLAHYAGKDLPDTKHYALQANGKDIVYYALPFAPSRRRNMAIHEHARWNAFMISKGTIPASIRQILTEKDQNGAFTNGNSADLRHHGNLTTFEGLEQFRKLVAQRDSSSEDAADVIRYDYQLLDDAYWLLDKLDYMIIPRKKAGPGKQKHLPGAESKK